MNEMTFLLVEFHIKLLVAVWWAVLAGFAFEKNTSE